MPHPAIPRNLALQTGVFREQDPDPNRIVLWVKGGRETGGQKWHRICNLLPPEVMDRDGVCATAAAITPFRQEDKTVVIRLLSRVKRKDAKAGTTYVLPTGESASPAGLPRKDVLLVWSSDGAQRLEAKQVGDLWPECEKCQQLGDRIFLVYGVEIPTPAKPQTATPPPAPVMGATPPLVQPPAPSPVAAAPVARPPAPSPTPPVLAAAANLGSPVTPPQASDPEPSAPAASASTSAAEPASTAPGNGVPADAATPSTRPAAANFQRQYTQLSQQVSQLHRQGRYEQAVEVAAQARDLTRQHLGEEHPEYATILNNMAESYRAMGRYDDAEPLYQQALAIWRKTLGEEHQQVATCLDNLGQLYQSARKYPQAEKHYQQSIALWRKNLGEQHPFLAVIGSSLAEVSRDLGDYGAAKALYEKIMPIRRAAVGEEHPDYARSLLSLADVCRALGRYSEAEPLYQRVLAFRRARVGENHPDVASVLSQLADLHRLRGDFVAAEPLFRQALATLRSAPAKEYQLALAGALTGLGLLNQTLRDYPAAESSLQEALTIRKTALGENHPEVAGGLTHLVGLYQSAENFTAAGPLLQQAAQLYRTSFGENHPLYAAVLYRLGVQAEGTGNDAAAEPQFRQALDIRRDRLGESHPDVADSLNALGIWHARMGRYAEAEPLLLQALEVRRSALGASHPTMSAALVDLATIQAALDRPTEALELLRQGAGLDDRVNTQVFILGPDRRTAAHLERNRGNLDHLLSLVAQHLGEDGAAVEASLDLVQWRKSLRSEAAAAGRDLILANYYPEHVPALKELADLRVRIAKKCLAGPGSEGGEAHGQMLAEWRVRKSQIEAELTPRVPEMSLEPLWRNIDRHTVALALPEGATLVDYVRLRVFDFKAMPAKGESQWKAPTYLAFVRPAGDGGPVRLIDLGGADKIDRMAAELRGCLPPN